ncbi:MAG: transposase [Bacteroidetes bacterium]|nr:transposase [Bacteroidota bacterium]MBL6943031.1 transposase [Bacteroidales bacterium]
MSDSYQINDQNAMYFLTLQVVFWLDVFTREVYRKIVIESLSYCRNHKKLEVYGYVIMSNHVHLMLSSANGTLSDTIRDLKKFTANNIIDSIKNGTESRRKWLLSEMAFAARKHKRNSYHQFWTHNNHAVELSTNEMMDQRLKYIHQNPVKAGIVDGAVDYLYSSARNYCDGMQGLIEIDLIDF